jgi:hypothetical protein
VQAFPEPDGTMRARAYFQAVMFDPGEQTRLVIGQYSDSMREVDGELRFTHKRITVERVVTIASGTAEYAGVTPQPAGQAAG